VLEFPAPLDAKTLMGMKESDRLVLLVESRLGPHMGTASFMEWCEAMLGIGWMAVLSRELYGLCKISTREKERVISIQCSIQANTEDLDQQLLMGEREGWLQDYVFCHAVRYIVNILDEQLAFKKATERKLAVLKNHIKKVFCNGGTTAEVLMSYRVSQRMNISLETHMSMMENHYFFY